MSGVLGVLRRPPPGCWRLAAGEMGSGRTVDGSQGGRALEPQRAARRFPNRLPQARTAFTERNGEVMPF